jgi:hypothetical protein
MGPVEAEHRPSETTGDRFVIAEMKVVPDLGITVAFDSTIDNRALLCREDASAAKSVRKPLVRRSIDSIANLGLLLRGEHEYLEIHNGSRR